MPQPRPDLPATLEAHLVRWRATSDPEAFGAVFDATSETLFRIALTLVPDAASAEDVVQQTYAVAVRKLARLPPGRPAMPWLVNVLGKEAAKARRRLRRRPDPARLPPQAPSGVAEALEGHDEAEAVRAAIDALDEPYRSAALLRWRYGLEPAEIAHVRGEAPGTTRSILSRALERLRGGRKALAGVLVGEAASPRGRDALRAAVVANAAGAAKAGLVGATAVAAVGGILVKKVAIVVGVALFALMGGYAVFHATSSGEARQVTPSSVAGAASPALSGRAAGGDGAQRIEGSRERLSSGGTVRGVVTDEDGRPVVRAMALLHDRDRKTMVEYDSANPDPTHDGVTTGADGRFEVGVPAVANPVLLVLAQGFVPERVAVGAGEDRRVVLRRSRSLQGRVMDTRGRPVGGARVALLVLVGAFHTERHATSSPQGFYRFEDSAGLGRQCLLVVDAEGYARQILNVGTELWLRPPSAAKAEVNVVLSRGSRVEGRVTDGTDGKPVPGARVLLYDVGGSLRIGLDGEEHPGHGFFLGEVTTGPDGAYAFSGVPCRDYHDSPGTMSSAGTGKSIGCWLAAAKPGLTTAIHEVELREEGELEQIDLVLRAAYSVEGRVVDARGRPVADAQVWVTARREGAATGIPMPYRSAFPWEHGTTAADGTYRLDGVAVPTGGDPAPHIGAASSLRRLGLDDQDMVSAPLPGPYTGVVRAPDLIFEARVYPRGRIRVVDAKDTPVRGARVGWYPNSRDELTDADGRVTVRWTWLRPREATLAAVPIFVHAAGYAVARAVVPLVAGADADPQEVRIVLEPAHRLRGRVTTTGGPLPSDLVVTVGDGKQPLRAVFPEAWFAEPPGPLAENRPEYRDVAVLGDGTFEADDLPAGPYHVRAKGTRPDPTPDTSAPSQNAVWVAQSDVPSGGEVTLVLPVEPLPITTSVEVRFLDADTEAPLLRPWGELGAGPRRLRGIRIEPGLLRFEFVPLGTALFHGGETDYGSAPSVEIQVTEDRSAEPTTVRLRRGVRVFGHVTRPDGKPYDGNMFLEPYDRTGSKGTSARGGGWYEARGLAPGRYRVSGMLVTPGADGPAPRFAPADGALIEVPAGVREVRADVRWVAAGAVGIRLVQDPAVPARRGSLTVTDSSGRVVGRREGFGTAEPGGRFDAILAPGPYRARFEVPDEPPIERRFDVRVAVRDEVVLGGT